MSSPDRSVIKRWTFVCKWGPNESRDGLEIGVSAIVSNFSVLLITAWRGHGFQVGLQRGRERSVD